MNACSCPCGSPGFFRIIEVTQINASMVKSTVGHITIIESDIGEASNVEHAKPPLVVYHAVKNKKEE